MSVCTVICMATPANKMYSFTGAHTKTTSMKAALRMLSLEYYRSCAVTKIHPLVFRAVRSKSRRARSQLAESLCLEISTFLILLHLSALSTESWELTVRLLSLHLMTCAMSAQH